MVKYLRNFLHQSESKEIDEMKRIVVVDMRKDRELKPEEDHIPDRQQSKRNGPYDLITSFSKRAFCVLFDA